MAEPNRTKANRYVTGFLLASTLLLFAGVIDGNFSHADLAEKLIRTGGLLSVGTVAFARLMGVQNA